MNNSFIRICCLCFLYVTNSYVNGDENKVNVLDKKEEEKECDSNLVSSVDLLPDDISSDYDGCSKEDLDAWLSPSYPLKGYHVICISSSNNKNDDIDHHKLLIFKQGLPSNPIINQFSFDKINFNENYENSKKEKFHLFRQHLSSTIGIAREIDPWHDADGFFQLCRNEHEKCQEWSNIGECAANPNYMLTHCGGSCGTCNLTHKEPIWRGQPFQIFDTEMSSNQPILINSKNMETMFNKGGMFVLFEGGQFIWPGIRLGYRRYLPDLGVTLTTLALQPLVVAVEDFLTKNECQHVIDEATPLMAKSKVAFMDRDIGKADEEFRTSSTYFLPSQTEKLKEIDDRVAALTRVPRQHQEYVQVLRYENGEYYGSHHDSWDADYYQADEWLSMTNGGFLNRLATVFWYMTDVEEGGETNFPMAHGGPDLPNTNDNCGTRGLSVAPREGKVIIFYSLKPDGSMDKYSLHSACPVKVGTKWAANKWVWNQPKGFIR